MHATGNDNRMVQNTGDGNQINVGDTIVHHHYDQTDTRTCNSTRK